MSEIPLTTVPQQTTELLTKFASEIGELPVLRLDIFEMTGTRPGECHNNVQHVLREHKGSQQYGWSLWQFGELWYEAEFHSVWVREDGEIKDVTPDSSGVTQRLFIKDASTQFKGYTVSNKFFPIDRSAGTRFACERMRQIGHILSKYREGEKPSGDDADLVDRLYVEAKGHFMPVHQLLQSRQ